MKYLHLIWAALFRRKTRTMLTLVSILTAFMLFGMLDAVRAAFDTGSQSLAGASRLITTSRYSIIQTLPKALDTRIAAVRGVRGVAYANWFGGYYQQPRNFVFSYAVSPNYVDLYPEIELTHAQRRAFDQTRTGVLVGAKLAQRYGWKTGERIPLTSAIFPQKNGSKAWQFDIVGIYKTARDAPNGLDQLFLLHWKYFDEANAFGGGNVGWYVERLADPAAADRVAGAIDALSDNSDHETKTQTERAFQASFAKQLGDIGLIVGAIMGAVFFTLILLTGNTMAQAVRERTSELAVLKTIGFSSRSVMTMVLAESVLMLLIGGLAGLGLAAVVIPAVSAASDGLVQLPPMRWGSWTLGIALMAGIGLLVGALPGWRAMRLKIVDALAGR